MTHAALITDEAAGHARANADGAWPDERNERKKRDA